MIAALILIPLAAGLAAFGLRSTAGRRGLLVGAAVAHFGLTMACWQAPIVQAPGDAWLRLDALGLMFLSITSVLFLAAAVYSLGYLKTQPSDPAEEPEEGLLFTNVPEAIFIGCLLLFLAAMTLVTVSQHIGILWIAVEATTLASAPLIYFHRHHRSLEATWKYLLICSVGIALALLGNFFLGIASAKPGVSTAPMVVGELIEHASNLQGTWLKAAFILFLVGYGTKMGLAPLHTWLPDAHSEAPSVISALLSGALLNCAFLGILRVQQVCVAAGLGGFSRELLVLMGLVSIGVAAVFILNQADYKRMLAYSSVEHMGILALGVGLGGVGAFGAMLHAVNHSLTKAMLFLVAGHILAVYHTKSIQQVRGLLRIMPVSGLLWVAGFFAITGTPPFGPFLSEFAILRAAFEGGQFVVSALFLFLLGVIFIGMATAFLRMAQGPIASPIPKNSAGINGFMLAPPVVLAGMVLGLGVYIPDRVTLLLNQAAQAVGGVL